jgi:hypothetical protein
LWTAAVIAKQSSEILLNIILSCTHTAYIPALIVVITRPLDTLTDTPQLVMTSQLLALERNSRAAEEVVRVAPRHITVVFPAKVFFTFPSTVYTIQ